VANLLHHHGFAAAASEAEADVLVINTCSIREKAEHRLYSDLGALREWKRVDPGRVLGVGGCVAQQEGDRLLRRFSHLDFVFGTHNLRLVPAMVAAAGQGERLCRTEESRSLERFDLPERHPDYAGTTPGRAFLTVMEGCDMFCSFCIVPRTRGREISRPADAIMAEARALAAQGICELTLLGQTVNAYGRHDLRRGHQTGTTRFATLLGRLAEIPGIRRLRYTSPHPLFFDPELVRAHGEIPALCPHVHLPVQSGSDRVLESMRRRYTAGDYQRLVDDLRRARPDLAITTDLIVGFPGETEEDFQATLELMRQVGFVDSFSFKYSRRPGTAAARESEAPDPRCAQDRLERLQNLQREFTLAYHRSRVGESTEILVEGESRRGEGQLQGRDPYHRVVNLTAGGEAGSVSLVSPGDLLAVEIREATPHSLIGAVPSAGESRVKASSRFADETAGVPART
jgi:tRNA-2-methylthio-N6-dimethylallyladenosine synthase